MDINHFTHSISGVQLVRHLSAEGRRVFTTETAREAAPTVGISPGYVLQAMHHLVRSGWLIRVKKGLYALSGAVPGTTALHEFEIAMALVQPAAISHWSAMSHHGLTEQVPRHVFMLTTARSVPRVRGKPHARNSSGYSVGGTTFRFVQVKPERFFCIEQVWVGEARIAITDPERTLLDGLMAPQYCGDFAEVLHAFELHASKLDVERIIGYALKLDAATAKRLGWVLERGGISPDRLRPLQDLPIKGYRLLNPSGPHQGPHETRWKIRANLPDITAP